MASVVELADTANNAVHRIGLDGEHLQVRVLPLALLFGGRNGGPTCDSREAVEADAMRTQALELAERVIASPWCQINSPVYQAAQRFREDYSNE